MAAVYPAGPEPMIKQLTFSMVDVLMLLNLLSAKIKLKDYSLSIRPDYLSGDIKEGLFGPNGG